MTFDFNVKEFNIGNGTGTPTFQFYRRGFNIGGSGSSPEWKDIILHGNTALTLVNAKADGLNYLKLFGGTEQRNLPSGYTQLEYIESTGTQYIDSGIYGDETTEITTTFQRTAVTDSAIYGVFSGGTGNDNLVSYTSNISTNWRFDSTTTSVPYFGTSKVTTVQNATGVWVDDTLYPIANTPTSFTTSKTIPIFCRWATADSIYNAFVQAQMYIFSIKKNNVLVFNGIPAKRNSDNVVGLYDTVSNTFLLNAGTGNFTAGPTAVPTPDTPMDIICNNGVIKIKDDELPTGYKRILGMTMNNDCFYQTSVYPTGADTLKFSYEWTSTTACNVLGCYTTSSAQDNLSLYIGSSSTSKYLRYNGGTASSYSLADKRYDVQITPTGSIGMEIEETWEQKDFTCSVPLCIGITGASATSAKFIGNLYENVEIVGKVKFIPCERLSDNEIGYYDTLNETFIEPTGTTPTSLGYDNTHNVIYTDGTTETVAILKNYGETFTLSDEVPNQSGSQMRAGTILTNLPAGTYRINKGGYSTSMYIYGKVGDVKTEYVIITTDTEVTLSGVGDLYIYASNGISVNALSNLTLEVYNTTEQTATAEMLLAVGSVQDIQSVLDGEVTRQLGVKVLDGTENWQYQGSNTNLFSVQTGEDAVYPSTAICTHYVGVDSSTTTSSIADGQFKYGYSNVEDKIYIRDNTYNNDLAGFKTYLATQYANGTPVIVVYPLATATTETVESQALTIQAGSNDVVITQASIDNLELEVSYKGTL